MTQREEYDSPWKEMLDLYFEQFMRFFFPRIAREIDWTHDYLLLDKELRQITREAELGPRVVDSLVKVWKRNGEEVWVLIHVEIQTQHQPDFAHRTYVYHYRIHDRYDRPVVSLAILGDDDLNWRPQRYNEVLWGCWMKFGFPMVKLADYREKEAHLERSHNPFAAVVWAHLKTVETHKNPEKRRDLKIILTKALYRRGYSKQEILHLYRFIDWIMVLPENLEDQVFEEIRAFEEEHKMQYITTAERIGMEKGRQKGLEEGLSRGMSRGFDEGRVKGLNEGQAKGLSDGRAEGRVEGRVEGRAEGRAEGIRKGEIIGEILLAQRLLKQTITAREELEQKSLEELQQMFASLEGRLLKQ